jgi:2-polyprenyl-3-methyl-5-hydroxy-6-metoxy-1,4-benzoquinol methylase
VTAGNVYDKYGSSNPVVRRLMARFEAAAAALLDRAAPASLLDVGCGEGVLVERWARRLAIPVTAVDVEDPGLRAEWARRSAPDLAFRAADAGDLPFADRAFATVSAMEVLEHVPDPEHTLAEMARVASRWLLVSVPREPLWRALNLARGAYVRELGNTPGHLSHWSQRGFLALLRRHGDVVEVRSPLPWTMVLVRV